MEWISALTACLALMMTIIGYFVKRHIESVERNIKNLNTKVTALKQDVIWITNSVEDIKTIVNNSNAITKETGVKILSRIESLDELTYQNKVLLKKHETDLENYGKVIRKKFLADKK